MSNGKSDKNKPLSLLGDFGEQPTSGNTTVDTKDPKVTSSSGFYVPWPSERQDPKDPATLERWSVNRAKRQWFDLTPSYRDYVTRLARAMGRRSGEALWNDSVEAAGYSSATGTPGTPFDYVKLLYDQFNVDSQAGMGPGAGSGRSRTPAYTGPVESVTVQAETDIVSTTQSIAQTLLGRAATQEELDKILKRTRTAEQAQPAVQTRQGPGRVTTEEGLTKEGRDAIARKVLMRSPDYAGYQIDSTVMDMLSNIFRSGQEVARG